METHTVENWTEVPFIGIQVSKFETPKNAFEKRGKGRTHGRGYTLPSRRQK